MGHVIKAALRVLGRLIWSYFTWILPYSGKNKDKYPLEQRYAKVRFLIKRVNKALDNEVIVFGKENIPQEVSCFYANHLGACDPLPMIEAIKAPVAFLAKSEIKKMPMVGRIFTASNGQFLDRSDIKQQIGIVNLMQKSLTEKEHHWFVFPEGTRNKDPLAVLQPFHYGTFRAAMKAGVPISPIATYSSFRLLKSKHHFKKYPTFVSFLPVITPDEYANMTPEEVGAKVRSMIQKEISFHLRQEDHKYMLKFAKKGYRFNEVY